MPRNFLRLALCSLLFVGCQHSSKMSEGGARNPANTNDGSIWNDYGGARTEDKMGEKHSPLKQINTTNVKSLKKVWSYRTGEIDMPGPKSLEVTPIYHDGNLYGCTIFNKIFAIDGETGKLIWEIDPKVRRSEKVWAYKCRGVAIWSDPENRSGICSTRVLSNTIDGRLLARDAKTGAACPDFREHIDGKILERAPRGEVNPWVNIMSPYVAADREALIMKEKHHDHRDEYYATSAPLVVGNLVILGGGIADNGRADATSGAVQAFDARTGALRWIWDPAPKALTDKATKEQPLQYGTPNAWAPMAVDESRGLVFIPTGSASPDYYAAQRNGKDQYASSIIALRVKDSSGRELDTPVVEWQFKQVIQDKWDYDAASQPVLTNLKVDGNDVPVVIAGTKMGFIFIMHRETGKPIYPTANGFVQGSYADYLQPVSAVGVVKGETLITKKTDFVTEVDGKTQFRQLNNGSHSMFQPFPPKEWQLHDMPTSKKDLQGFVAGFLPVCKELTAKHDYFGYYTPPSLKGAINLPGAVGGIDWGGVTIDPVNQILYVNQMRVATISQMLTREQYEKSNKGGVKAFKEAYFPMENTPYGLHRFPYMDAKSGLPCSDAPYGMLKAVSLRDGKPLWTKVFGDFAAMAAHIDEEKAHLEKAQSGEVGAATNPELRDALLKMIKEIQTGQPSGITDPKVRASLIAALKVAVQKRLAEAAKSAKKGFTKVHALSAGVPNFGGSLVTDGGLLFIGAAADGTFRIYNSQTGDIIHEIPLTQFAGAGSGAAVPMTYMTKSGKQIVVIASGGNKFIPGKHGDAIIAFGLE